MAVATSTMLGIALAASVVGTGVSVYAGMQQAKTTEKVAEYNAQVQANNAKSQRNNAMVAVQQASVEAERKRRLKRKVAGTQIANAAKSGTTISGSVSDVMYDSAIELENEALIEIYKGNVAAHGYESMARGYDGSSSFALAQGKSSANQSILGAVGSGISGIGSASSIGYNMSQGVKIA